MNSSRQERKTNEARKIVGRVITGVDRGNSFIINYQQKLEGLAGVNSHENEKGDKLFNKAVEYRGNKSNLTSPA
ncbi:hypothetical protein [Microcoleus sp. K5-D4]|uniref:hypothetical protein n=1 Tax=Microcoleus sp. K5-D4 TaxID=2818801 RepID=UPI002FCE724D